MRMVKISFIILICSVFFSAAFGQIITVSDSVTFSGIVIDGRTNEGLSDVPDKKCIYKMVIILFFDFADSGFIWKYHIRACLR